MLSPKELALAAAEGGPGGSTGMALPANGQSFGFNPADDGLQDDVPGHGDG